MHQAPHPIPVLLLGDQQPRVAGGDAQPQRALHVLGDVDGDDRRDRGHHLAGLLLVQVEHARQHPRLPRVDLPAGVGLGDQALELVGRAALLLAGHVDPEQPQDAIGHGREHDDHRVEQHPERLQRARHPPRDGLGAVDRVELRNHLAGDELHGGHDQVGEDHRDRDRHAVADRGPERFLEDLGERRRAQGADRDRGHRHPDLDRGDVVVDVLELFQRQRRSPRALLLHHLQTRLARAHERVLGDHEERVHRDQHDREDELQAVHASESMRAAIAKSASVRPPSEWVLRSRRTLFQPCTWISG